VDALEIMEISDLSHRPTHLLSFGQRKRVAIAGILAMSPSVLLLDEPTAGLDPKGVEDLTETLDALAKQGVAVVVATHDMDAAYAGWRASQAAFLPDLRLVGRGRIGRNMDAIPGRESDLSAMLVLRFRLYSGGVDTANRNARVREIGEARQILIREQRSTEEAVRQSWIQAASESLLMCRVSCFRSLARLDLRLILRPSSSTSQNRCPTGAGETERPATLADSMKAVSKLSWMRGLPRKMCCDRRRERNSSANSCWPRRVSGTRRGRARPRSPTTRTGRG
jgi:hypothetical protein